MPNPLDGTLPMTVGNMGFLVDRLGQDCSPLQFVRELTQNAIEAIERTPEKSGDVVWDVDWNHLDLTGVRKLCITDTGVGMTGPEMGQVINGLSASAGQQSATGNFGVGAKIAAATRNHAGLVYVSFQAGRGALAHLWRNPVNGIYGLKQLALPGGSFAHWAPVDPAIKPPLIRDRGTMVLLLGNDMDADTTRPPEGTPFPSFWISRYLNCRYYEFKARITVRAREGIDAEGGKSFLRTVTGMKPYLERHSAARGEVSLSGAVAHWWILKDEEALSTVRWTASSGHTGALFQSEIYELVGGRTAATRLQTFGVVFGHRRVVIYVEPLTGPGRNVKANTARTHLLVNGEPLPWAEWAAEFAAKMPDEIVRLVEESGASSVSADYDRSIRERLNQIRGLFNLSRYRPSEAGRDTMDPDVQLPGGTPADSGEAGGGHKPPGGQGGEAGLAYSLFLAPEGPKAQEVAGDLYPVVRWVSTVDGTRDAPDLEDRAAKYLSPTNVVLANADFRLFRDTVKRWQDAYARVPGSAEVVEHTVRQWMQQTLVETVLGCQSLRNTRLWSSEDVNAALSEQALTAAVMPRYHVEQAIRLTLARNLGAIKDKAA